jgi:hypothetical protein
MYCGEMGNNYSSLAWKQGLHPSTLVNLSSITSNFKKYVPIGPFNHLEDYYWQFTIIICSQYLLWIDGKDYIRFAWKLGLHPSTLAHLSSITSNFKKWVPIRPFKHMEDY